MDFFEAQARAKRRTTHLVLLFTFAVLGTASAGYFAGILIFRQISPRGAQLNATYWTYQRTAVWREDGADTRWWDPRIFAGVVFGTLAVVGLASLYKWGQYSSGGGAVAESVGGRRVDPHTTDLKERRLLNVLEEMAIASGTPVPAAYILEQESAINAFAAGFTTSDAVVAVTRGTLDKLSRDELQGVIGHEFSHILNGDMRLNLRITALVFGILVLGLGGRGLLWSLRGFRTRGKGAGGLIVVVMLVGLALLVIGYVGYFFGRIIQAAVSRQREFLADASAVQFTRNPAGLTGALRKIGGYALGSSIQANQSAAMGHFFFAQAFRSGLTGLWSTHPPLPERIRAIDPQFDGRMFEPPEVVDVARESFVAAGLAPPRPTGPAPAGFALGLAPRGAPTSPRSSHLAPASAIAAVTAIGTLTPEQIDNVQLLLEGTPARLREASHTAAEAPVLVYGLLLDSDPAIRQRQHELIATHAGPEAQRILRELGPALDQLGPAQKLPLLQLALPSLRQLPAAALATFVDALDELVHADQRVSIFEFALQKLLLRTLDLGRQPRGVRINFYSFNAVVAEISIVLSVLARIAVTDPAAAPAAFAAGAAQLKLVEPRLTYLDESSSSLVALDTALDKLAAASGPIKQRTLVAAAHVVGADGQVRIAEAELLRAIAAALDVPMPPLLTTA
jgi:Zn-dependent protease with chaperone function